MNRLERPIFFVGMPRSGTTIIFETLARHPALGWLSNYCRTHPLLPWRNVGRRLLDNRFVSLYGHKRQYGKAPFYNIWLPQPDEAYEFWDAWTGVDFSRRSLAGVTCGAQDAERVRSAVSDVVRWQGRQRFAAKTTGPPRIGFLHSIFPDALFVHVVRDGRAVTHSLLNVPFWRAKGGFDGPFWGDLLDAADLAAWRSHAADPGALAALQWRRAVSLARREGAGLDARQYVEVSYEDFTGDPHGVMSTTLQRCGLDDSPQIHDALGRTAAVRNMNEKYRRDFEPAYVEMLEACMAPTLREFGYL